MSTRIAYNSSSSRKLWQDLYLIMRKTDDPATPSPDVILRSRSTSSRKWMEYIRQAIQGTPDPDYVPNGGGNFNSVTPTTVEETEHLIASAPYKHCLLDTVPTTLSRTVPRCWHHFCRSCLTDLIVELHSSFAESRSRQAITEETKRGLDKEDRKNYRSM